MSVLQATSSVCEMAGWSASKDCEGEDEVWWAVEQRLEVG